MIELPEALTLASEMTETLVGKTVEAVLPPTKPHKFCWSAGDPEEEGPKLAGAKVSGAKGFGIYAELQFDNGLRYALNDGVNLRLVKRENAPKDYQRLIVFSDGDALALSVQMYGGIILHDGTYDNEYYLKSLNSFSPFDEGFERHFFDVLAGCKGNLSMKAVIATEQRFPGVGNGTAQDILFNARLHPKRKLSTLSDADKRALLDAMVEALSQMRDQGGRDTEKDLFGAPGGYRTLMSKNALERGCPACGAPIKKEAYLGGAVYYCPHCQPIQA